MAERTPMPIGLDFFQLEVGQWANETFPKSTPHTIARHLFREAIELCLATMPKGALITTLYAELKAEAFDQIDRIGERRRDPHATPAESADVFLLALHLAHKQGFSLLAVAHTKHEENRARAWGEADAAGVVEHVRDGEEG
jgi:hypothetical protein